MTSACPIYTYILLAWGGSQTGSPRTSGGGKGEGSIEELHYESNHTHTYGQGSPNKHTTTHIHKVRSTHLTNLFCEKKASKNHFNGHHKLAGHKKSNIIYHNYVTIWFALPPPVCYVYPPL